MKPNLILIQPQPPPECTDCSILDGSAHFYEKHDGKWDGKGAYCERTIPKCLVVKQAVKIGNAWLWAALRKEGA
ncbi:MAG TPA: hypothetical protein VKX17_26265 [Planctomycetota bacterium]|nr:hypothetical protein [Planctomycetota bacterium]